MTAKPIILIRIPNVSVKKLQSINKSISDDIRKEYFVFVVNSTIVNDLSFEIFYEKDFNEVKYKELKQLLSKEL